MNKCLNGAVSQHWDVAQRDPMSLVKVNELKTSFVKWYATVEGGCGSCD